MSSCYIPVYYEKTRTINGTLAFDGGLSNNQPLVDAHTIAVAPIDWGHNDQLEKVSSAGNCNWAQSIEGRKRY